MEVVKNPDTFRRDKEIFGLFEEGEFGFDHVVGYLGTLRMLLESSHTPLRRCVSAFASPREIDGRGDVRFATGDAYVHKFWRFGNIVVNC